MAELQAMKKLPGMQKLIHLKNAFINKIRYKASGFSEVRVLFDQYLNDSLKVKTREKRAVASAAQVGPGHDVHDEMSIATISLKDLLASNETKKGLTEYLGKGLLAAFDEQKLVVSYGPVIASNYLTVPTDFSSHSHEEADSQIGLHVIHSVRESTFKRIVVLSPDTDVLISLLDLEAQGHLGALTDLILRTGKGKDQRDIDIRERVQVMGRSKARGLIGLHNFTGADWGGKWVGISKRTWSVKYFCLADDDPIIHAFSMLGELKID
jgi:hypothetical protein